MSESGFTPDEIREDGFLGGRVRLRQPRQGYRAATDPVFLAAAVPAGTGDRVLDLGCGAGAASLCLAARVPGLDLHGLDLQPSYLALASANAALNGVSLHLHAGDVADPPRDLRQHAFDQVMLNPPYHAGESAPSPVADRDRANREDASGLAAWLAAALARLEPGGWLTLIHRAERTPAILALLDGPAGAIALLPLVPRAGREAGRVIVRARKGSRAPFRLLSPLVIHAGAAHLRDGDDYSPEATAILRAGAALDLDRRTR